VKGVALGLFSEDPGYSYAPLFDEIAALGANEVELVVPWYQVDGTSTTLHLHPRYSPTDAAVAQAIDDAHARHLAVLLFPIVRLETPRQANDWRGTLAPTDIAAWFASYGDRLLALATLGAKHHAEALSVGSELSTLDVDPTPWKPLVARVRTVFAGTLTYSGNWDHYSKVGVYSLVDLPGLCGYFALGPPADDTLAAITAAWKTQRQAIEAFFATATPGKRILFTELGYLSQTGNHAQPWAEGATDPVDLDEQTRCFRAFIAAWSGAPSLEGPFIWNWFGWGGPTSGGYTPRGKPAAQVIADWYGGKVITADPAE
jgi:hypothetical protein